MHNVKTVSFNLFAFPSREAKIAHMETELEPTLKFGNPEDGLGVDSALYRIPFIAPVGDIFVNGIIPTGRNAQYTAIYNWIKSYTGLPFGDVFENEAAED